MMNKIERLKQQIADLVEQRQLLMKRERHFPLTIARINRDIEHLKAELHGLGYEY